MELFHKHDAMGYKIICFDCRRPICEKCMTVTPGSLLCRSCSPHKWGLRLPAISGLADGAMMKLQCASIGYSALLLTGLSLLTPCLG